MSETILEEAQRHVYGDRNEAYGPPLDDFQRTADMATGLFRHLLKDGAKFEPEHVAYFMVLVKLSRCMNAYRRDNHCDGAGYFGAADRVFEERSARQAMADIASDRDQEHLAYAYVREMYLAEREKNRASQVEDATGVPI